MSNTSLSSLLSLTTVQKQGKEWGSATKIDVTQRANKTWAALRHIGGRQGKTQTAKATYCWCISSRSIQALNPPSHGINWQFLQLLLHFSCCSVLLLFGSTTLVWHASAECKLPKQMRCVKVAIGTWEASAFATTEVNTHLSKRWC